MKTCIKCFKNKEETGFALRNKTNGLRHNSCKECHKEFSKKHYVENKSKYKKKSNDNRKKLYKYCNALKESTPCTDCKLKYPHYIMDFDHLRDKKFNISRITCGLETLKKEIEKCEIVCANCHRKRTYMRKLDE